ncbi:hypothetical protein, partial [Pseudomonas syringae group sp. J248-6]|uniref:hypothetical protein n=1 Tax=Pseudomonas syringae group sp. J248-6 TaxID=3079590 RepID=UPI00290610EF
PKVVGSNPAPATKHQKRLLERVAFFVLALKVLSHALPLTTRYPSLISASTLRRKKGSIIGTGAQSATHLPAFKIKG